MGKQEKPGAVFGFCVHIHFKGIWSEGESGGTGAPPRGMGEVAVGGVPSSLQGTRVWAACGGHVHMLLKRNGEEAVVKHSDMQVHGRRRTTTQLWGKFWGGNSVHGLEGRHTEHVGTDPDHVPFNARCRTHCCRGRLPSRPSVLDETAVHPGPREGSPNIPRRSVTRPDISYGS